MRVEEVEHERGRADRAGGRTQPLRAQHDGAGPGVAAAHHAVQLHGATGSAVRPHEVLHVVDGGVPQPSNAAHAATASSTRFAGGTPRIRPSAAPEKYAPPS